MERCVLHNDNSGFPGGAFPSQTSVGYSEFTDAARKVHGSNLEVLDAFIFGNFDVGEGCATVRATRHSLFWGKSLSFGANAIAGGQQAVDVVKLLSVPRTQFKEAIRPVPQISGQVQLSAKEGISVFGASASRTFGDFNVAIGVGMTILPAVLNGTRPQHARFAGPPLFFRTFLPESQGRCA